MLKILIVDDEVSITTLIDYHLQKEGYETVMMHDGYEAYVEALEHPYDFIVLDVMLPNMDGMEILKELRKHQVNVPVLLLTAKDETVDKIIGIEFGADDYMTKPFSPRELTARIKGILRRTASSSQPVNNQQVATDEKITIGELTLNLSAYTIHKDHELLDLTKKEFELLAYFMNRPKRIIDRETLLHSIWNEEIYAQSRVVDIHISHLREKIEKDPKNPNYIHTIRGFGYKFDWQQER
ncbi:response regulator transcription factor [Vagococcus xieshaowenii]|uniref:Response regulator transcription factor n=1 Tax=Vagococcus xieshaowenii TaxID=2562451 RepID=A0AAJ5EDW8_9ENTE|nr:response regulator transcription factor [Vagococcus xieshaowenii]QCA28600.1 response regulator transcription factor [Vagococcus xieshaowenii]TFZ40592.1 response regulator transcription factor [Vagococcus xieshaowenii]